MEEVELSGDHSMLVRAIEPRDREALLSGFERLSPESRYRRFFSPQNKLSDSDLRYLTEVDHDNHEAVIGFDAESGEPIGVARYVRDPEHPSCAEVAVTVVDDWHGRGVATALLRALTVRAREQEVERFVAVILGDNRAAVELFSGLTDEPPPVRRDGANVELLIELPEPQEISDSMLGKALRTAAAGELVINPWRLLKRRVLERDEDDDDGGDNRPHR